MVKENRRQVHHLLTRSISIFAVASAIATTCLIGCKVSETDVRRWGSTEHGPDKLVAVLTHDKYAWDLRVESALELLRMKPRSGRRIGINRLVESLALLPPDDRKKIIDGMLPQLIAEMSKPPPTAPPGQAVPPDPSYAYKDAAMAILTYDKAVLVSDDNARKQLVDALISWSQHDFDRRLDNTTQMFGMEQMMRALGPSAVKGLASLITLDSTKYDRIASMVAEQGDQATKEATAAKLVDLAKFTASQAWIDKNKPAVEEANKASKIKTKDQLVQQIVGYKPQTHVSIEYIESLDDWKTAWDHIHFRGFLGTKMTMQFTWQGCDSILAGPLVLDLARLALFAQRRGEIGVLKHLACFFKNPMGVEEHDFFKQFAMLEDYVRELQ